VKGNIAGLDELTQLTVDGELRIVPASGEDKLVAGAALINGNLTFGPEGQLIIEVDDPSIPALEVLGATTLSGGLVVEIPTDTVLTENQLLQLVVFTGGVTGAFSSVSFPVAPEGFLGNAEVVDGVLKLTVVNPGIPTVTDIPGDVDGNAAVDAVDVQLVINGALNLPVGTVNPDLNCDTAIDAVDVQLVINAALGIPIAPCVAARSTGGTSPWGNAVVFAGVGLLLATRRRGKCGDGSKNTDTAG